MLKTFRNILRVMAGPIGMVDMVVEAAAQIPRLAPHQQRVVDEKAELDVKIGALAAFIDTFDKGFSIFAGLPEPERQRLYAQHRVMVEYSAILGERIAAFEAGLPRIEGVLGDVRIVPAAATPTPAPSPVAAESSDRWKPTIGRIVTVKGYIANGSDEHPGMITRVFGVGEGALVNVTVFPDLQSPKILSSIPAYTSRTAARDAIVGPSRANGFAFFPDRG